MRADYNTGLILDQLIFRIILVLAIFRARIPLLWVEEAPIRAFHFARGENALTCDGS